MTWSKRELLSRPVEHIDIRSFDARPIVDAYDAMAFQARNLARAAQIYSEMLEDEDCAVILTLAGSLISAGLKQAVLTLLEHNMVDAIVATGANVIDQDFFEGLGFRHYQAPGSPEAPPVSDEELRRFAIDRIYDTYIDEDELRICDDTTRRVFESLPPGAYSSRQLMAEMGRYLDEHHPDSESIVRTCYHLDVPIFVPAFSDCSAGFGIVLHQAQAAKEGRPAVAFDSGRDFLELCRLKLAVGETGLLMLGGGVPKNFAQDSVVGAELLLEQEAGGWGTGSSPEALDDSDVSMHKYAIQLTVADVRDGALSGSTLREATSWGKVESVKEQMVYGELTTTFPVLASDAYHRRAWEGRQPRRLASALDPAQRETVATP